jgi:hypothetical protein
MYAYSVPAYRRVLEHAELGEVADRVTELGQEGKRSEARRLIDSEYLDRLGVVIGDEIEPALERWRPLVDRIALGVPWYGMDAGAQLEQCRRLISALASIK